MPDPSAGRPLLLPEKHFTEDEIQPVAEALAARCEFGCARRSSICRGHWNDARAVLEALATAGRLLPPDAEHREEWAWRVTRGDSEMGEIEPPQASREEAGSVVRWHRTHGLPPVTSSRLLRRDVLTGPWVEVDGSAPSE